MPMTDGTMQDFPLTLDRILDHAAKWHPRTEVVTARDDGGAKRIGYDALRLRAKRVSRLLAHLGVTKGDRVATLAWNSQAHLESWYAIMGMGAVCHTLNPRLTADQLSWMLAQSAAEILFVSTDLADLAFEIVRLSPGLRHLFLLDEEASSGGVAAGRTHAAGGAAIHRFEEALAGVSAGLDWGGFEETAPCGLCFTSGTTGQPKGVTYTHRANFLHTLRQLQADVAGITSRDVVLPVVPMFHANAWGLPFAAPATGAKLVLPGRHSDGASLARLIEQESVTIAVGVPTVWIGLMDHLDETGLELPSLKRIMVGGAPMPPALMVRIEARGVEVQATWGMTELSPLGTSAVPGDPDRHPAKSGTPALGVDLRLTDHDGRPLAGQREVEGHLWVRGSSVVQRYFGQEEDATRDGWFCTGDLALIDEEGRLTITGRSKDLIKSGGEWINPAEIEAIVAAVPEVALAAVIGRPHPRWGERPLLLVEMRDDAQLSDEELLGPLAGRVAKWWIPDEVVRIPAMPLAATGKIDKMRLRAEFEGS